jgi:HemY protein
VKNLFTAFIVALFAIVLTLWVKEDNGYVLIGYGEWTVEGSLALFTLANLLLFLLLYLLLRSLARIWSIPRGLSAWRGRRCNRRAQKALTQGLVELSEGHWKVAEKQLVRYAHQSETPLLNYLAAARAAQLQGEDGRRDHYLQQAHQSMPMADVAVGLTQAELQLAHQQYEQALATLTHLRSLAPKHVYVLRLLRRLYESQEEWQQLEALLPELRKRKVADAGDLDALELRLVEQRLQRVAQKSGEEGLRQAWGELSASLRRRAELIGAYSRLMLAEGRGELVESLLADALRSQWSESLLRLFGAIERGDPAQRLELAESWLRDRREDPLLLFILARLCLQNKLWGKARSYFEASIAIEPNADAYRELGALLEQMDEPAAALDCYREGLRCATESRQPSAPAALPPPAKPAVMGSAHLIGVEG